MSLWNQRSIFRLALIALGFILAADRVLAMPAKAGPDPILLLVTDPLAKELACACVKGYGQRDYRKLAARLEAVLRQRVSIEFSDDVAESMTTATPGQQVIIIGERGMVTQGAKEAGLKCHPVCALTGLDGTTTFSGSFVARSGDAAGELKDLRDRKVFFGLARTDENQTVTREALRAAGVEATARLENRGSYSDAALDVLDSKSSPRPVAVIPSYVLPMLEGCGSVKAGELKVIGKTQPMPFVTVFLGDNIPVEKEQKILQTLLAIRGDAKLLKAMETRDGFKPIQAATPGKSQARAVQDWPDWRGAGRDGHVSRLPSRLPEKARFVWKKAAMTGGLAGISVSGGRLILAERDFGDEHDVYRCLNAENGELLWRVEFPARGRLDYGQSPRATPVIHNGVAYLLSAFGDLKCVNLLDGKVVWERQLPRDFQARLPTWGMCSTPLVVDGLLIVNPGSSRASLAALDCVTGRTRWTTPGAPAAYAAFICGEFGGRRQIVGYDQKSLGGWDVKTGERLWRLVPAQEGDFNVPTPVAADGSLVVSTENNGTRLYRFDASGRIIAQPAGEFAGLCPDTVTPVAVRGRVFGVHNGLHCLDLSKSLQPIWHREEPGLGEHATLIADDERVLVITLGGELLLLDGRGNEGAIISRLRMFDQDVEVYSHPALVGTRLYARGGSSVVCLDLQLD
jgi:outer membrane protein assembly factor BamB